MKSNNNHKIFAVLAVFFTMHSVGCHSRPSGESADNSTNMEKRQWTQPALVDYQRELLDLAFGAATNIPKYPHLVDRSRAQRKVVTCSLDLEHPEMAAKYAARIGNWRRGTAHADIALFYALHGLPEEAKDELAVAEDFAEAITDWHRDRIDVHIARALEALGDRSRASEKMEKLAEEEAAKVARAGASYGQEEDFATRLGAVKKLADNGRFDVKMQGLLGAAELYGNDHAHKKRRAALLELVEESWGELAAVFRIEVLFAFADQALQLGDAEFAKKLLRDAQTEYEDAEWRAEFGVPVLARMARLQYRTGDPKAARKMIGDAQKAYAAERDETGLVFRVKTMVPIAAALCATGRKQEGLKVYAEALEEAVSNPNARPRTLDLVTICCSMAREEAKPPLALWSRLQEVRNQLGEPW